MSSSELLSHDLFNNPMLFTERCFKSSRRLKSKQLLSEIADRIDTWGLLGSKECITMNAIGKEKAVKNTIAQIVLWYAVTRVDQIGVIISDNIHSYIEGWLKECKLKEFFKLTDSGIKVKNSRHNHVIITSEEQLQPELLVGYFCSELLIVFDNVEPSDGILKIIESYSKFYNILIILTKYKDEQRK